MLREGVGGWSSLYVLSGGRPLGVSCSGRGGEVGQVLGRGGGGEVGLVLGGGGGGGGSTLMRLKAVHGAGSPAR